MPETPVTRRFTLPTSVLVAASVETTDLPASVEPTSGEGIPVMCDVVSEVVDSSR